MANVPDVSNIGYKRAVGVVLLLTIFTPGILYLYFKNFSLYSSLDAWKIFLFGLSIPGPILALNLSLSTIISYTLFNTKRYQGNGKASTTEREGKSNKKARIAEEVINRISLTSSLFSTAIVMNLGIFSVFKDILNLSYNPILSGFVGDVSLVILFTFILIRKADKDFIEHNFGG